MLFREGILLRMPTNRGSNSRHPYPRTPRKLRHHVFVCNLFVELKEGATTNFTACRTARTPRVPIKSVSVSTDESKTCQIVICTPLVLENVEHCGGEPEQAATMATCT